jgi:hypothetical protein
MLRRFLSTLILIPILSLFIYTVLLNPADEASGASQGPTVVNKTTGCDIKAQILGNEVVITLKNNHKQTATAFTIRLGNSHGITADFAYSDVHSGIAPGEIFQRTYPLPTALTGSLPTVYLLTVLLENGHHDGNLTVAQDVKDERLGEKIQILRTLRILDKHENLRKDVKALKDDVAAALNTPDSETLAMLSELEPPDTGSNRQKNKELSDNMKKGLQVGREKMLRRLSTLEQLPNDSHETAIIELKTRFRMLLTRL